jgi:3-oxoacyl-[acyl-carrier-protein] synthase-1
MKASMRASLLPAEARASRLPRPAGEHVVIGVGARTHAGLTALQATLATRAGKMRPRESHLVDRHGEPISMCRLPSIADDVSGLHRFVALGAPALMQATWPRRERQTRLGQAMPVLPVVVALPSTSRPGFDRRLERELFPWLQERAGFPLDPQRSALITRDRGGGVEAFRWAMQLLDHGSDAVVVGGIDSYFDPDCLEWLDAEYRLHALGTENGFIPGEGAAFLLLVRRSRTSGARRLGSIVGAAVVDEPRPYGSEEPCHGLGMSKAILDAAAGLAQARQVPWILTDVANERHRVDEWQLAASRSFRCFTEDVRHDQPLLRTGDVGAASAAMLVAMACTHWEIGSGRGDMALIATHSDGHERGAMVLAREEGG